MIPCISADSYQRFQRTCLFPIQRRTVFFTLKMKAAESCETFAPSDTLRHILENFNLHIFVCCLQGYNSVEGFQRFGSPNCLNLQGMRNQQWHLQSSVITLETAARLDGWFIHLKVQSIMAELMLTAIWQRFSKLQWKVTKHCGNLNALLLRQGFDNLFCINWRHNTELLRSVHTFRVQNYEGDTGGVWYWVATLNVGCFFFWPVSCNTEGERIALFIIRRHALQNCVRNFLCTPNHNLQHTSTTSFFGVIKI
jgi:hypothetical protein